MNKDFKGLEISLGYSFKNPDLLQYSLTHPSSGGRHFQRLEFLGDRLLAVALAEFLYEQYPRETEGDLARRFSSLASGSKCREIAIEINLHKFLIFSNLPEATYTMIADAMEALIGAVLIDGGRDKAIEVVLKLWNKSLKDSNVISIDSKTALQEWAQANVGIRPDYKLISKSGPDHNPLFEVEVTLQGYNSIRNKGESKQSAEQNAASDLLDLVKGYK